MYKRQNDHQSMSKVLQDFVTNNKLQKGLDDVAVRDVWKQVMGPAISKYTNSIRLEREALHVQLSSSVLREELSYGKEKIIKNLNDALGKILIKKVILR